MKYITIIYGNKDLWRSFPPEEAAKAIREVDAFNKRYRRRVSCSPRMAWATN